MSAPSVTAPVVSDNTTRMPAYAKTNEFSKITPISKEINEYINFVIESYSNCIDTMAFWAKEYKRFPILSRIAARVLASSACSSDLEMLFSRAGIIFTPLRESLAPDTLEQLSSLHYWYKDVEKLGESNQSRVAASANNADLFIVLIGS